MQKWGLERKGSRVSVVEVQELKSKVTFAAKELYLRKRKVWEELRVEYKKIIEFREYVSKCY